jgi:hypothetical protein
VYPNWCNSTVPLRQRTLINYTNYTRDHVTGCTAEESEFDSRQIQEVFYSHRSDWIEGPLNILPNRYRGLFSRGESGWGAKLISLVYSVPWLRIWEAIPLILGVWLYYIV